MKNKGEFESAMHMYKKAIQLNPNDPYSKHELDKLTIITQKDVDDSLKEAIFEMSQHRKIDTKVLSRQMAGFCTIKKIFPFF